MNDYKIGKVVGVSGERVFVSLIDHTDGDGTEEGVPSTMIVNLPGEDGPIPLLIGQPGTFVSIGLPSGRLLAMITTIDMKENPPVQSEIRAAEAEGEAIVDEHKRVVLAVPVGTVDAGGTFERGTDVLPTVNSSAFAVPPATIDSIYRQYAEGNFSLGYLSLIPDQQASINLDAFLARHGAILGQTGGGKSWTVASFLQKITAFPQSTVVLFDLHGEYASAFGDEADVISGADIELPYWLMNSEELLGLMVDRASLPLRTKLQNLRSYCRLLKTAIQRIRNSGLIELQSIRPCFLTSPKSLVSSDA